VLLGRYIGVLKGRCGDEWSKIKLEIRRSQITVARQSTPDLVPVERYFKLTYVFLCKFLFPTKWLLNERHCSLARQIRGNEWLCYVRLHLILEQPLHHRTINARYLNDLPSSWHTTAIYNQLARKHNALIMYITFLIAPSMEVLFLSAHPLP